VKSIVRQCLGFLALLLFPGSYAYGFPQDHFGTDDMNDATLTICNKGTAKIHVVVAVDGLFRMNVGGWANLSPGDCERVYKDTGTPASGSAPAYIGFGFIDSQNHITRGHIEQVPDFGQFPWGTKVLTKSNRRLCVRNEGMSYSISGDPACESLTGGYVPLAAALYIRPIPTRCDTIAYQTSCFGGHYYLNIKPTANDRELHASAGTAADTPTAAPRPDAPTPGKSQWAALKEAGDAARGQSVRKNVRAYIAAADTGFESYKQGAPRVVAGDRVWSAKGISLRDGSCIVTESATDVIFRCLAFTSSYPEVTEYWYADLVKNVAAALPEGWKPASESDVSKIFTKNVLAGKVFWSSSGLNYFIWTDHDSEYQLWYQVLAPRRPGEGTRNAAPSRPVPAPAPNRPMTPKDDPIGEGGFITPYVLPKK
jgi:uncharacterized protein DUF1036